MGEVSRFLGISIHFCQDFDSPAHFHASYESYNAVVDVEKFAIFSGSLPPRVAGLVVEWAAKNQAALKENWELHKGGSATKPIPRLVE